MEVVPYIQLLIIGKCIAIIGFTYMPILCMYVFKIQRLLHLKSIDTFVVQKSKTLQ